MKPGPEKEFDCMLPVAMTSAMKEFLAAEAKRLFPDSKRGGMGAVVRQFILNGWVARNRKVIRKIRGGTK